MKINYKSVINQAFHLIVRFLENADNEDAPVVNYKSPDNLRNILDLQISDEGIDYDKLFEHIDNYLKYSVNTRNKQFFNQLYSGTNIPGFLGEVFSAVSNTSMYTYEVAPAATLTEKELIGKMCGIAGFKNGSGIFVTGGSNANLLAMFSARNKFFPEGKINGMQNSPKFTAFVSDQAHYSFGTAANLLGIGAEALIKVKSDEYGKMMPEELEKEIFASEQRHEIPFFVAATAGTTLLGAFDSISDIDKIAKKHNCWMHLDGSFGGSIILSSKYKNLFKGIETVDSFTWNPHKLMNIPLITSVFLLNHKNVLKTNLTKLSTDYIFHENEAENCDLGEISIQCGRKADALKLWTSWKYYGDKGYEKRINNLFDTAEYFEQKVIENEQLELMSERQTLTVCFRYNPGNIENLNVLNAHIREELRKSGKSMVNYGYIGTDLTIRFVVANPEVQKSDIDIFFKNFFYTINEINID
ncbi:MAG: glutamate decarboxylase [Chlorobi bacterium]|nr:glutamate decarboxylase [Chlorobiota bacterium]